MLFGYVIGLPLLAYLRLRMMNKLENKDITSLTEGNDNDNGNENVYDTSQRTQPIRRHTIGTNEGFQVFQRDHKIYGAFSSAFRPEMWWWEGTVEHVKLLLQ